MIVGLCHVLVGHSLKFNMAPKENDHFDHFDTRIGTSNHPIFQVFLAASFRESDM